MIVTENGQPAIGETLAVAAAAFAANEARLVATLRASGADATVLANSSLRVARLAEQAREGARQARGNRTARNAARRARAAAERAALAAAGRGPAFGDPN